MHYGTCQILQVFIEEFYVLSWRNLPDELCKINEHIREETDKKDAEYTLAVLVSNGTQLQSFLSVLGWISPRHLTDFAAKKDAFWFCINARFPAWKTFKTVDIQAQNFL